MQRVLKINILFLFILLLNFVSCSQHGKEITLTVDNIIPKPVNIIKKDSVSIISSSTKIQVENKEQLREIEFLINKINKSCNWDLKAEISTETGKNIIQLEHTEIENPEGYLLNIENGNIILKANTKKGFFYGIQTLRQIFPANIEGLYDMPVSGFVVPNVEIVDYPRFHWRGLMLDVSRHFFSVKEIKSLLDNMALHKLNKFHWHLVDDQGWRIEIKKYPKLTDIGSWRVERDFKNWNNTKEAQKDEKASYGGYYTQEQIKEIVEYAKKIHITVIPEIEMPAHVMSAIAAYPELSCTGDSIPVPPGGVWPITNIYCPGKETTFTFLEDVLSEVIELFPSEYIHIGGDEATKTNWEICTNCQKRIKEENLDNTEHLQAYMIKRIENFLNKKGRKLIGWDEILEGELPPRANVMSWRGVEGGIEAAEKGHNVVMSPNTHAYFDYYQGDAKYEPKAFNKSLPIEQVYKFNPVPENLRADKIKHILGGQANVWTEYIPDNNQLQYMVFPRIAALSEAVWTQVEYKNWDGFIKRLQHLLKRYEKLGINYAKSIYLVNINYNFNIDSNAVFAELSTAAPGMLIKYSINSAGYKVYKKPIRIDKSVTISAYADDVTDRKVEKSINIEQNKALGAKITYKNQYTSSYTAGGKYGLVDGIRGSDVFGDKHWQGWIGDDIEFVLDLGKKQEISKITLGMLEDQDDQIFFPKSVLFYTSVDGTNFNKVAELSHSFIKIDNVSKKDFSTEKLKKKCRYIKVVVKSQNTNLTQGEAWLFIDETIIR
ncbi:MAG: family 20 glycosylhydrolase [Bacteroidota bacterium]